MLRQGSPSRQHSPEVPEGIASPSHHRPSEVSLACGPELVQGGPGDSRQAACLCQTGTQGAAGTDLSSAHGQQRPGPSPRPTGWAGLQGWWEAAIVPSRSRGRGSLLPQGLGHQGCRLSRGWAGDAAVSGLRGQRTRPSHPWQRCWTWTRGRQEAATDGSGPGPRCSWALPKPSPSLPAAVSQHRHRGESDRAYKATAAPGTAPPRPLPPPPATAPAPPPAGPGRGPWALLAPAARPCSAAGRAEPRKNVASLHRK